MCTGAVKHRIQGAFCFCGIHKDQYLAQNYSLLSFAYLRLLRGSDRLHGDVMWRLLPLPLLPHIENIIMLASGLLERIISLLDVSFLPLSFSPFYLPCLFFPFLFIPSFCPSLSSFLFSLLPTSLSFLSLYIFSWDNMVSIVLTFFILMQCYCTTTKVPLPFCPLLKFIKNHYNRFAIVLTIIPVCSYLISPASNCLRPSTNALVLLPAKASYLPPITWYPWSMSVFQRLFINTISLIMTK